MYAFYLFLRKFHSVNLFNSKFYESGGAQSAEEKMENPFKNVSKTYISECQQNVFYLFFSHIRINFEPVQGPCTMNGKFLSFNMEKAYQNRE